MKSFIWAGAGAIAVVVAAVLATFGGAVNVVSAGQADVLPLATTPAAVASDGPPASPPPASAGPHSATPTNVLDTNAEPVPENATRAEGARLAADAHQMLACVDYFKARASQLGEARTNPDASADDATHTAPMYESMHGMRPEIDCTYSAGQSLEVAVDELKRAAAMGDLDAREELLEMRLAEYGARAPSNDGVEADPASKQEAAAILKEMKDLSMQGSHPAGFAYASALRSGQLGIQDAARATAWTMVAMQSGDEFDTHLVESYSGYSLAPNLEKAALMRTAKDLFSRCCSRQ